jgi:hypothetical protein
VKLIWAIYVHKQERKKRSRGSENKKSFDGPASFYPDQASLNKLEQQKYYF